jgi:hypothetical protein
MRGRLRWSCRTETCPAAKSSKACAISSPLGSRRGRYGIPRCRSTHLRGGRTMTGAAALSLPLAGSGGLPGRLGFDTTDRSSASSRSGVPVALMRSLGWRHGRAQRPIYRRPWTSRGGVVDPMNQLAYLKSGRAFSASLVPPGRTIFLSIIFRLVKGTTTYFVPRPRKPPTDRTA